MRLQNKRKKNNDNEVFSGEYKENGNHVKKLLKIHP